MKSRDFSSHLTDVMAEFVKFSCSNDPMKKEALRYLWRNDVMTNLGLPGGAVDVVHMNHRTVSVSSHEYPIHSGGFRIVRQERGSRIMLPEHFLEARIANAPTDVPLILLQLRTLLAHLPHLGGTTKKISKRSEPFFISYQLSRSVA